jgi:hypothetical protein
VRVRPWNWYVILPGNLQKSGNGTIIGLFYVGGKITGGKFAIAAMIIQAFATDSLPAAGFIGAVAVLSILLFIRTIRHTGLLQEMFRARVWR